MSRRSLPITLFLLCLVAPAIALAAFPAPTGFVNDFAGVLKGDTRGHLESLLSSFEKASGDEVAVATLPSLEGRVIDELAPDLYKQWGIGKKGKDNGVLFLVAPNERKMRIEVGYGLEGAINDALAGRLLDENVLPRFKAGEIDEGIAAGAIAIVKTIVAKEGLTFDVDEAFGSSIAAYAPAEPRAEHGGPLDTVLKILVLIVMIYLFIRHPWLFLLLLSSGRGGGGGGSFGGGFGGFGGGMSGGGGASRGW